MFKSLLNLYTVPSGSFGSTEQIERLLLPCTIDGAGDGVEEFGEIDLARDAAVEASRPGECTVSKLKASVVEFGDLRRWDGTRETGRLETWEFRRPFVDADGRKNDIVEIHE